MSQSGVMADALADVLTDALALVRACVCAHSRARSCACARACVCARVRADVQACVCITDNVVDSTWLTSSGRVHFTNASSDHVYTCPYSLFGRVTCKQPRRRRHRVPRCRSRHPVFGYCSSTYTCQHWAGAESVVLRASELVREHRPDDWQATRSCRLRRRSQHVAAHEQATACSTS